MKTLHRLFFAAMLSGAASAGLAQFQSPPSAEGRVGQASTAADERTYKKDGARHLYAAYGKHIWKGKMKPNLYGVAIVKTTLDASGAVTDVQITRPPAAPEVGPWVTEMIRRASPFPAPGVLGGVTYTEIWLVDKSGRFQLDTLTEGQL
jgi:periplasmic protein TonB